MSWKSAAESPEVRQRQSIAALLKTEAGHSKPLLLVSFLALLVSFVAPFALSAIIDRVILFKVSATLYTIIGIMLAAAVFEALLSQLRGRYAAFSSARVTAQIAGVVVDAALRQPTTNLLGSKGRATISTLAELNFFRDSVTQLVVYALQLLFSVAVYLVVLLLLHPIMTLAVLLTVPVHAIIYWLLARGSKEKIKKSVATNSEFIASAQTAVGAIETIHAYGLARQQIDVSSRLIVETLSQGFDARDTTNTAQSVSRLLSRVTEAAVIFLGAGAVMANELTLGELVVFQLLLGRMTQPISQAGVSWDRLYRLRTIAGEWQKLIDAKTPVPRNSETVPVPGTPLLQVTDLEFVYPGARTPTLHKIDLSLHGGEILFLLGPSGSGKSTLVRLLTGIIAPGEGQVLLRGLSPPAIAERSRRKLVAAAFQESILLPGTIGENISSFDPSLPEQQIRQAAEIAGAADFIRNFPDGYDTMVGTTGHAVSGGERQRICLARMLACEASIMIVDEGTSGLQRSLEVSVIERIKAAMAPDQALIIITHREDLMRLGTRAVRLEAGQVIDDRPINSTGP